MHYMSEPRDCQLTIRLPQRLRDAIDREAEVSMKQTRSTADLVPDLRHELDQTRSKLAAAEAKALVLETDANARRKELADASRSITTAT